MPTIRANGIDIRYELLPADLPSPAHGRGTSFAEGLGEGTPLVLTHGFAGPLDQWIDEVRPLAERRPLLMYDVRGHDRTTVPPDPADYSIPTFAADLAALLRALNIDRAHIGGVSMGGIITAQFAVDFPEMCASVLLCDTTCGNAPLRPDGGGEGTAADWERRMRTGFPILMNSVREAGMEATVRREWQWSQQNDPHIAESPYTLEGSLERIKLMTAEGYLGAAQAIIDRPDLIDRIPAIAAPTLVMIGAWDDFLPCALRDHKLISGSRLVIRNRCGHGSRWRLDTFLTEIQHFLDDVEAGRSVAGERTI